MDIALKLNNVFKLKHILKTNHISIKWRLFNYLAIFTTVILILLWLLQVVFINNFYKIIKVNSIKSYASNIAQNINNLDLENSITNYASDSNSSIAIIDENDNTLYSSNFTPFHGRIGNISSQDIKDSIIKAKENGGSYLKWLDNSNEQNNGDHHNDYDDNNEFYGNPSDSPKILFRGCSKFA